MISGFIRDSRQHEREMRHVAGSLVTGLLAVVTLGSGILNLVSVVGGASQPKLLVAVFPLEFSRLSRTLAIPLGFALIVSSLTLWKRKKRAWGVAVALTSFSTIFHLTAAFNYEEAALSLVVLLLLLLAHNLFTVKSSRPDLRSGVLRLLVSAAVALGY